MKSWWKIPFGVVCGLLSAGIILLATSQPRGEAITLSPPPSPPPVVVQISGAVNQPGVYSLPMNSRVKDALNAAGGLASEADAQSINQAAFLTDGDLIWIPYQPSEPKQEQASSTNDSSQSSVVVQPATQNKSILININTATQPELESLPHIGPVIAQRIIAYRESNGSFMEIESIQQVDGIGPATFEDIKDLITVNDLP